MDTMSHLAQVCGCIIPSSRGLWLLVLCRDPALDVMGAPPLLSAWLSQPCWGLGLLPSCCSRSPDVCVWEILLLLEYSGKEAGASRRAHMVTANVCHLLRHPRFCLKQPMLHSFLCCVCPWPRVWAGPEDHCGYRNWSELSCHLRPGTLCSRAPRRLSPRF